MNAFIGTIHAKTDGKGRVFVPASFRKILPSSEDSCLILRKDIHQNCLVLHTEKNWEEELNKLQEELNVWGDEDRLHTFRMISASAEEVKLDSSGRLLIPKKKLQEVKITTAVCFVGVNKYIEIWNPDQLTKVTLSADDLKSHVRKFLSNSKRNSEKPD